MNKKFKNYNFFEEKNDIPKENNQNENNYNNFEIYNKKTADIFEFDKVIISPNIIIKEFPQISSIVEEYKKNDKNLKEEFSLKSIFHFDSNYISPIDIKSKKYLTNLEIKNIYEKYINDVNNNAKIELKNVDLDKNKIQNSFVNNDIDNKKNKKKNFYFDKNIIPLPQDLNENITFQTFQILDDFKKKSYEKISLNSNSLIQPKISLYQEEKSYIKSVFNQYKENHIFAINKESFINKIKLKDCNFNEIKNINDILKRKKYKNIFEQNKNMLNEKPIIELNENKNECLISYQIIIKKLLLFDNIFSFDKNTIKKLDITNNINIKYFDSNKIINSYKRKNLKLFDLNNNDTVKKMNLILEENEKNDTIFSNNQKRLVKKGFTKRIEKPEADNEKLNLKSNIFHLFLIENISKNKFKSFSLQNNINEKIKINKGVNIFNKIIYTYKKDINTSRKIKIPKENSIKEINNYYSRKNLIKIYSPNNLYSKKDELDIFNDIDIDNNYKLYKKFKNNKRKKMNKFLKSGKASTFLVNNNDLKMNIAYSQVYYSSNYNNIENKTDFSLKKDNKKFKNQLFNSTLNLSNKNKTEIIKKSNMNYLDLGFNDNEKEKKDSIIILKKIMKNNNEINRKNKKVYINKLKKDQDNKFEQELKKEKRFKFLFPIFFSVIPLFYALYQKFIVEE